jgi:hypothetical protein
VPGKVVGPSFSAAEVPEVIEAVLDTYRRCASPRPTASRNLHRHAAPRRPRPVQGRRQRRPLRGAGNRMIERTAEDPPRAAEYAGWKPERAGAGQRRRPEDPRWKAWTASSWTSPSSPTAAPSARPYLLRRRGFTGDIRATGDVLIDQLVQMQRTGFSSAVLKEGKDPADAERQFARFAAFYQGDAGAAAAVRAGLSTDERHRPARPAVEGLRSQAGGDAAAAGPRRAEFAPLKQASTAWAPRTWSSRT